MKLFVPGRVCIFGEHSDWAGGYRRINSEIEKGYAIVAGTNQGIYAEAEPHPSRLIIRSTLPDGPLTGSGGESDFGEMPGAAGKKDGSVEPDCSVETSSGANPAGSGAECEPFEIEMDRELLIQEAQKGGFYSYACGVAYQILTHYQVRGLVINNYRTDLPIKKGLSSSAALCVLVARAFNRLYDLKMTIRGEMEYAYLGEVTTPSRCGRMDQGCAYGSRIILMSFDGDHIDVRELRVPRDLYFVLVDLNAGKDTREILARLNQCYPFAQEELQKGVQQYLGPTNKRIVHQVIEAFDQGDAEGLGRAMTTAQQEFDRYLQPACPQELTAPVLHKVLAYPPIQPHILGGKGVGSGGDGSAQFIVKDEASQKKVMDILEKDLGMSCLPLVLRAFQKIRKAIIPAAGFGTRLFPASKAIKKELFPIIDSAGRSKPVILAIVEEAINAGIEQVGIIVQSRDKGLFEDFFYNPPFPENYNKLSREDQQYCDYLMEVGRRVSFIVQDTQEGFGHAVYCAREWVGAESFLLMLGDTLYASTTEVSCTSQLLGVYERYTTNMVGMKTVQAPELRHYGCLTGRWEEPDSVLEVTEVYEKPEADYARGHLTVESLPDDTFLALSGQYIMGPRIFGLLEESIRNNLRSKGEFQLTSCLDALRREEGMVGYLLKGDSYDIGVPEQYRRTLSKFTG
jgi:UTP-glucose-1-phosphate uridylyltransferase/mevalonate kinase